MSIKRIIHSHSKAALYLHIDGIETTGVERVGDGNEGDCTLNVFRYANI